MWCLAQAQNWWVLGEAQSSSLRPVSWHPNTNEGCQVRVCISWQISWICNCCFILNSACNSGWDFCSSSHTRRFMVWSKGTAHQRTMYINCDLKKDKKCTRCLCFSLSHQIRSLQSFSHNNTNPSGYHKKIMTYFGIVCAGQPLDQPEIRNGVMVIWNLVDSMLGSLFNEGCISENSRMQARRNQQDLPLTYRWS